MKKTYRGTCLLRATAKGINVWIPYEQLDSAKAMPEDDTQDQAVVK